LDFKEAAFGCEKDISFTRVEICNDCKGTGAKDGTAFKTCSKCNGKGVFEQVVNTLFGQTRRTSVCEKCRGTGKEITTPCPTCSGKGFSRKNRTHHVSVPAGVDNGQRLSFRNEGHHGRNGGENGNLIVNITVRPHEFFKRKGFDLFLEYPITAIQAAMGCTIKVPTLDGFVSYDIPAGTQYGTTFTIRKKGIKKLFKDIYGDLFLTIIVEIPTGLTKKQAKQLSDFDSTLSSDQFPKCKRFKKNIT
jgi:molecular chaperone DnaJ